MKKLIIVLLVVGFIWALAHGRGAEMGTTGQNIASSAGDAMGGAIEFLGALFK